MADITLNEAEAAGFSEIDSKIRLLGVKVRNSDNESRNQALEDLEDYHARALDLRVMRNNTLTIELEEKNAELLAAQQQLKSYQSSTQKAKIAVLGCCGLGLAFQFPEWAVVAWNLLWPTPAAVMLTAFATWSWCAKPKHE